MAGVRSVAVFACAGGVAMEAETYRREVGDWKGLEDEGPVVVMSEIGSFWNLDGMLSCVDD